MQETIYWKDIDLELNKKANGDIADMINYDAIENSLDNIFKTMQYSRRMLPEFALPIYRLLFEPLDMGIANSLGDMILYAIERWEQRIVVDNINILIDEDNNQYEVILYYHIVSEAGTTTQRTFTTILQAR